ncbi:hypothetical protein N7510_009446 [Penicillium lagena]|uniref:uncharacterized protein n=1 Tax=Penicillium lagena TaxID=94218 RepID=UPI002541CCC1|nr:uncharacterized protein N7510_009446 [Penicillium lagena]KAJ5606665.1 hypothetical protein N7510_009446 [Penicillium lagena]
MIRFQFLILLVFCTIALLGPSIVQCAPIESAIIIDDAPDGRLSPFEWSDELSKHNQTSDLSAMSTGLRKRGWMSALSEITSTAKKIGSSVIEGVTTANNYVQAGKDLLSDFSALASDAKSTVTGVKNMAQEAITNISKLPINLIASLKDETRRQLEQTLGSLTQEMTSKLPAIGGLETTVASAIVHLTKTGLDKLENIANARIAKLDAVRSHVADSINALFDAPADRINKFLTEVVQEELEFLTAKADEYYEKINDLANIIGEAIEAVKTVEDAANYDWTNADIAIEGMISLVIEYTNAQDSVTAAEEKSGLPRQTRISVHVFVQLSDKKLGYLETYLRLHANLRKRAAESTMDDVSTIKKILEQQGIDPEGDLDDECEDDYVFNTRDLDDSEWYDDDYDDGDLDDGVWDDGDLDSRDLGFGDYDGYGEERSDF